MFDMTTVFLFGALICAVSGIMLFMSRHLHRGSLGGVNAAAAAEGCLAIGMLLLALRGVVPGWMSGLLAGSLGLVASALIYESTRRITGEDQSGVQLRYLLPLLVVLQWMADLAYPGGSTQLVVTSLLQGGFVAACVPLLWRAVTREQALAVNWGIAFAVLYTVAHTARALLTGLFSAQYSVGQFQPDSVVAACAVLIAMAPMIYAMVIISMVNGRVSNDYRRQAEVDVLTGVHTRRSFFERASAALHDPRLDQQSPALLMLDLDKFKSINDLHGHAWGDRVLVEFSKLLRASCPANALIGRFGGEEFCVMLFCADADAAHRVGAEVVKATRGWQGQPGDGPGRFTVSAGLAMRNTDCNTLDDLLIVADRRLYMAKSGGRDQIVTSDLPEASLQAPDWIDVVPV